MITEEQIAEARNKAYFQVGLNAYFGNGFDAGVKFAEQHYQSEKAELVEIINDLCEDLAFQLDRLGVCGQGDGIGRKADNESYGSTELLSRAKQLLTKIK